MPTLEPFTGHVVAAGHAARVVAAPFDALTPAERRRGVADPDSFLGVLPPRREDDAGTLERCRAHLGGLLAAGRFVPLTTPALAVLRVDDGHHAATGVVGEVSAAAFADGRVLPHERVHPPVVAALRRHLEVVGAVSSPVCVAHRPDARLRELLEALTAGPARVAFSDAAGTLRLWLVDDPDRRDALAAAVGATAGWMTADGHHRAEAARPWGRVLSVLVAEDELTVRPFHRRVETADPRGAGGRLRATGLEVAELAEPASPRGPGEVTVAGGQRWWRVRLPETPGAGPVDALDAVRVRGVLTALLGAAPTTRAGDHDAATGDADGTTAGNADDATAGAGVDATAGAGVDATGGARVEATDGAGVDDPRVQAVAPTREIHRLARPGSVTVLLHPPTWADVRRVVEHGGTMPPKSTYVVPKQRSGVVVVPRTERLP